MDLHEWILYMVISVSRYRRNRRFPRRRGPRRQDDGDNNEESHDDEHEEGESEGEGRRGPPRRRNMRRRRPRRRDESENTGDDEEHDDYRPRRRRGPRTRAPIPTLFVGSIQRSVRVSELKGEIRSKDVNPIRVIWNGAKGYSLLQFQEMQEMESALDALQNLEIRGRKLRVEKSNRLKQEDSDNAHDGIGDEKPED